jgi:hypothetical protein
MILSWKQIQMSVCAVSFGQLVLKFEYNEFTAKVKVCLPKTTNL